MSDQLLNRSGVAYPSEMEEFRCSSDGYVGKNALALHDYQMQVQQLNAIADTCGIALSDHIVKALRDAAKSIDVLSLKQAPTKE